VADKPIIIKRYENRKLYDTSRSAYVTLEELAELIRQGKEIQVVDAKTNEDLTKNTLALIILEEERNKKNPLPLTLMYQLIKYGALIQGTFQEAVTRGFETLLTSQMEAQKRMREWAEATVRPSPPQPDAPPPDRPATDELEELRRKVEDLERRLRAERKSPRKKSSR
jgi:polyhydroxyalkanoate synthesis repressor PhaR